MKKSLLSLFFAFLAFTVFAQRNFKPGYIIQKGDTLKGQISQKGAVKSSQKVIFRPSSEATAIIYTPSQIDGYGTQDGHRFESFILGKGDTARSLFLNVLVQGKTSLYAYRDEESEVHYYVIKEGTTRELIRKKVKEVQPDGQRVLKTYDFYKGTLQEMTQDCPALTIKRKKLTFNQNSFSDFIVNYNQCTAPTSLTYISKPEKVEVTWGAVIGGAISTLQVENVNPKVFNETYNSGLEPTGGLFINSTTPWVSKKLSFQLEALYNRVRYAQDLSDKELFKENEYKIDIDLTYLKVPLLVRYSLPVGKVEPFVNIGMAHSFAIKHKQEVHITSTSSSGEKTEEQRYFLQDFNPSESRWGYVESFRSYSQSFFVGTGAKLPFGTKHKLSLEARYEASNGFSGNQNFGTDTKHFLVLVGFSL
ncbi:outer membrane beta-barrel protein [Sabulibacter ruber]|uniref:outer membrane beta-barrel protein n=1 Tax=Sabulibacter ruber TaxID=2811901 RepID=UPI001A964B23|nr:outer membrane beta-barrel protein [Sabulibacter ruber]